MMRVLLYHRLNIGDLVIATPAIQWLKNKHPEAEIRLITNNWASHIGKMLPGVSQVHAYNKCGGGEWRVLLGARRWKPDIAIGLSPAPDKRLAYRLAVIGNAVGYADASLIYKFAYRQCLVERKHDLHVAERLGRLFGVVDLSALPPAKLDYKVDVNEQRYTVGIHLDARKPSNRMTPQQLLTVIDGIQRCQPSAEIALTAISGSGLNKAHAPDKVFVECIRQSINHDRVHLFNDLDFAGVIDIHARCDSAIMPDGGLMHVAAALGKPVVGLFGNSDPQAWRPFTPTSRHIQTNSRCVADINPASILHVWELLVNQVF